MSQNEVVCIKCGWRKNLKKGEEPPTTCPSCGAKNKEHDLPIDTPATLLEYFTEDQLLQLAEKCSRAQYASQGNGQAEVFVRFMNGRPRFFGVQTWEEAQR